MNYIAEINAFEAFVDANFLPTLSQILWYKLMSISNRSGWQETISVTNLRLMTAVGVESERTFISARNELIESGLLVYEKGVKGRPGKYTLISLCEKQEAYVKPAEYVFEDPSNELKNEPKSEEKTEQLLTKTEIEGTVLGTVSTPLKGTVSTVNFTAQTADIYKLNKTKLNQIKKEEENVIFDAVVGGGGFKINPAFENFAGESGRDLPKSEKQSTQQQHQQSPIIPFTPDLRALHTLFAGEFGRPLSPLELDQLVSWSKNSALNFDLIKAALSKAVVNGSRSFRYIDKILLSWEKAGVRSLQDVEAEEAAWEAKKGGRKLDKASGQGDQESEMGEFERLALEMGWFGGK